MLRFPFAWHEEFVARQLQRKRADQDGLLDRIPTLDDLQAAWLLLARYLLRSLQPSPGV